MGRYYDGDISGKFWFGVQSSTAADRFGGTRSEPNYVDYYFEEEDLDSVVEELNNIVATIGQDNINSLDNFFNRKDGYNDKSLEEAGLLQIYKNHIENYADYRLGVKIRDCIMEKGSCSFTAEL